MKYARAFLILALLAVTPAAALTNPAFLVTDPAASEFGWETRGAVSVQDGAAVLQEDDRLLTRLAQTFTVPPDAKSLRFTIVSTSLTTRDPLQPPDAFEVALLDASTSASLVGTAAGLSNTDSFLNLQPNGEVYVAPKVTLPGAPLRFPLTVEVDLRGLAGTRATLSFDLLGFSPTGSSVAIDNVFVMREGASAPVVSAGGSYSGIIGQPVSFDGSGTTDPDSPIILYEWDFESDGVFDVSSGSPTASHTYPAAGTYMATLRVTDDTGLASTGTAPVVIRPLNSPPVAVLQGPSIANEGQTATFSGTGASDPDGDSLTYQWSFGDGSSASGPNVTHAWPDNGTFAVSLTVADPAGLSATRTSQVTVANVAPMVAVCSNDESASCDQFLNTAETFTSTGRFTDPGADSWTATIDYGDGSGVQPLTLRDDRTFDLRHTYKQAGKFTVAVTVTDDDGGVGRGTALVTVQPRLRPPVAVLQGPTTAKEGQAVAFSGAGSTDPDGDPLTFAWSFGDGGSASGPNVTHTWADNGSFAVLMTVTDPAGLSARKGLTMVVSNVAPVVDAGPDVSVAPGVALVATGRFTDPGADTWTAKVDYGDGTGQQALTLRADKTFELRHTYPAVGSFTVRVTVTDDEGGAGSDTVVVTVNRPPVCTGAKPSADRLWPPNHKYVAIQIQGATDPDKDAVTIVVDRIRQDEPVNGTGDGDTAPDGQGIGTAAPQVRAERAGTGNGRVYHLYFTARDTRGGSCTGDLVVGVPHDQGQSSVPVDDGPLFDSTMR